MTRNFFISHTMTDYAGGETSETYSLESEEGGGFDDLTRGDLKRLNDLLTHYLYGEKHGKKG